MEQLNQKKIVFPDVTIILVALFMLNHFNTYRRFLFGLLIVSYSFSVFQKPVFEVLHLLYHIPEIVYSTGKIHSYQSHDDEVHQHQTLAKLEVQANEQEQPTPTKNKQEIKKKIEIVEKAIALAIDDTSPIKNNFRVILPFKSALIKIHSPPPQLFS